MEMLYHYYEKVLGPFRNLSDLPAAEAEEVLGSIRREKKVMASRRPDGYLERRRELEQLAREMFIAKGGKPIRTAPHYMVVGECEWLKSWYDDGEAVHLPISSFDSGTLSFTYGDLFPTFSSRVRDGREYRRQVYTYNEILPLIQKYGLPQIWNRDGAYGPERYIEVQVWDDQPMRNLIKENTN